MLTDPPTAQSISPILQTDLEATPNQPKRCFLKKKRRKHHDPATQCRPPTVTDPVQPRDKERGLWSRVGRIFRKRSNSKTRTTSESTIITPPNPPLQARSSSEHDAEQDHDQNTTALRSPTPSTILSSDPYVILGSRLVQDERPEVGPVDDTSAITTTALIATVATPVMTEISASRITFARRQGAFSPTAASCSSAEAAEAASDALRQHRLYSMSGRGHRPPESKNFPGGPNNRSHFDQGQRDGEVMDDGQSDDNDNDNDNDHDHDHNHDDNTDDNGSNDSEDEAVEFSEWERTYAIIHGNYRTRLGSLQLQLCDDIHQRLVQHQNEMKALEQEIVQELKVLAPGFSRTMQSLMEHNFEHNQKRQAKCCEEIGETLFALLGGAMIATAAYKGNQVLQESVDDGARWTLFQWSGNEWPIAKVECDTEEDLPTTAGQEREEEEDQNQHSHILPTTSFTGVNPSISMRTVTAPEDTSAFSDSTSKSEGFLRGSDRQMPSAPPPTRQTSIVSEPPSPSFVPHSREQEFVLPSGRASATGHTRVTNQFHGGVHYHYASTCCHCFHCCYGRQEHRRAEDPITEDDDNSHPRGHCSRQKNQRLEDATSSSSGSSESRTCATSGTDISASCEGANSEVQNAIENRSCSRARPPGDTSSSLPASAIPTWAKRPNRFTKTAEATSGPTQTCGGGGGAVVKCSADSHPLDHASLSLAPRPHSTKMNQDYEIPKKETMTSSASCSHGHLSQVISSSPACSISTSPSQATSILSSSNSEAYRFSGFSLPSRLQASAQAEPTRSLARKPKKDPSRPAGFVHYGHYNSGRKHDTPPLLITSPDALRRMSRRRRHPEIQSRLAMRSVSSMDVWQLRLARIRQDDNVDDQEEYDSDESSWVRFAHIEEAMMVLEGQREAALKLRLHRMAFRKSRCQIASARSWENCCTTRFLLEARARAVDDPVKDVTDIQADPIDENELWRFYNY